MLFDLCLFKHFSLSQIFVISLYVTDWNFFVFNFLSFTQIGVVEEIDCGERDITLLNKRFCTICKMTLWCWD